MDSVSVGVTGPGDKALILQAQAGSSDGLDAFIAKYEQKVFTFLLAMVNDQSIAEALLGQTFSDILKRPPASSAICDERPADFGAGVYRFALACLRRHWRRQDEQPVFSTRGISVERSQVKSDAAARFERASAFLPREHRLAFVLRDVLQVPLPIVADITDTQEELLAARLRRARLTLIRTARQRGLCEQSACREDNDGIPEIFVEMVF